MSQPPQGYPPQGQGYPPQGGYPPSQGGPPQGQGWPPQPGAPRQDNSKAVLIGVIIVLLIAIATVTTLWAIGVFDRGGTTTTVTATPNSPTTTPTTTPVPTPTPTPTNAPGDVGQPTTPTPPAPTDPTGPRVVLNDDYLRATWKENCSSSQFMRFNPDSGIVTMHTGQARFTRSGNTLTINGTRTMRVILSPINQNSMRATAEGNSSMLYRCPAR